MKEYQAAAFWPDSSGPLTDEVIARIERMLTDALRREIETDAEIVIEQQRHPAGFKSDYGERGTEFIGVMKA